MKKTLNIHFGRQLFTIEEDAYDKLQQYLNRLELSLKNDEGASEIIEDIEMRFAELLLDYLGETRKVVNSTDISRGIASLGEPEDITEDEYQANTDNAGEQAKFFYDTSGKSKRLFRDPENGILGGVCSGLAAYLNSDPVIIRIIFVILLFFVGMAIPLYLILWIIIPYANSPSDRLRMHGKPVTVDSLKEEFEKGADKLKSNARNIRDKFRSPNSPYIDKAKSAARSFVKITGLAIVTATFLWMMFYVCFVSGLLSLIPSTGDQEYLSFSQFMKISVPNPNTNFLFWITVLTIGISTIIMAFVIGFRLLTGKRYKWLKPAMFANALIFCVGVLTGIVSGIQTGRDFAVFSEIEKEHIDFSADKLEIRKLVQFSNNKKILSTRGVDFIHITNGRLEDNGVILTYKVSKDSLYHISQIVSAHGVDRMRALSRAGHIRNSFRQEGSTLIIDPLYNYPAKDGMRNQQVEYIIEVPVDKTISVNGKPRTVFNSTVSETFRDDSDYDEDYDNDFE